MCAPLSMYSYGTCTARSKLKRARVFWSSSSNPLVQFPPLVFMDQSLTRGQTQPKTPPNLLNQPCLTTYQHSLVGQNINTALLDKISTPPCWTKYQHHFVGQNINLAFLNKISTQPCWTTYQHSLFEQNINTALLDNIST